MSLSNTRQMTMPNLMTDRNSLRLTNIHPHITSFFSYKTHRLVQWSQCQDRAQAHDLCKLYVKLDVFEIKPLFSSQNLFEQPVFADKNWDREYLLSISNWSVGYI